MSAASSVLGDLALAPVAGYLATKVMEPVSSKLYELESEADRAREDAARPGARVGPVAAAGLSAGLVGAWSRRTAWQTVEWVMEKETPRDRRRCAPRRGRSDEVGFLLRGEFGLLARWPALGAGDGHAPGAGEVGLELGDHGERVEQRPGVAITTRSRRRRVEPLEQADVDAVAGFLADRLARGHCRDQCVGAARVGHLGRMQP